VQARDVMTTTVVSITEDTPIEEIARTLLEQRISAVPVLDAGGNLVGIVSEGDLMRREESGTERRPGWWLALLASPAERAASYLKTHGRKAKDVMTRGPVTVDDTAPLGQIADTLERLGIKRVPVLRNGELVGIVSRANLLQGLATAGSMRGLRADDETIRTAILETLHKESGVQDQFLNVTAADGIVHLWGTVGSEAEKQAVRVVAENTIGARGVEDHVRVLPASLRSALWAE